MTRAHDPSVCPLCGRKNGCAMAQEGCASACATCWCSNVKIAPEVLSRVPPHAVGRACLCAECAQAQDARARA
ncbi:MAG TPA: cysteine-rich CWC family protein [Planctomycetota bacterium]|nr:cysteine-rich CWC family protein [Planctomycetota bacterium]